MRCIYCTLLFTLIYHLYSFNIVVVYHQLCIRSIAMMNNASGQSMDRPMHKAFPNYDYAEL
jgi:hypothetical protein